MLQAEASVVVPYQVLQALPYIMTIVTLVVVRGKGAAPSKLGQPYEMR
jgi:simple sugar transport system permease protein